MIVYPCNFTSKISFNASESVVGGGFHYKQGFWFNDDGKLISKNESIKEAHKKVIKMIHKDKKEWKNNQGILWRA